MQEIGEFDDTYKNWKKASNGLNYYILYRKYRLFEKLHATKSIPVHHIDTKCYRQHYRTVETRNSHRIFIEIKCDIQQKVDNLENLLFYKNLCHDSLSAKTNYVSIDTDMDKIEGQRAESCLKVPRRSSDTLGIPSLRSIMNIRYFCKKKLFNK